VLAMAPKSSARDSGPRSAPTSATLWALTSGAHSALPTESGSACSSAEAREHSRAATMACWKECSSGEAPARLSVERKAHSMEAMVLVQQQAYSMEATMACWKD